MSERRHLWGLYRVVIMLILFILPFHKRGPFLTSRTRDQVLTVFFEKKIENLKKSR